MKSGSIFSWPGFFSTFFMLYSCAFSSRTTKKLFSAAEKKQYDLIIVPGVPFDTAGWSRTMKARVYWSKYLFDRGIAKNIMYSGSAVYTPYYEAEIMALYAKAIGIPEKNIFTELKAEHSTENVYYSYRKAGKLGFDKIALASDPFQTKMLRRFIRKKMNSDIALIPIVFDTLRSMEPQMTDPEIEYRQAFSNNFKSLAEREGFWKRLRGTRGLNIDSSAYR